MAIYNGNDDCNDDNDLPNDAEANDVQLETLLDVLQGLHRGRGQTLACSILTLISA